MNAMNLIHHCTADVLPTNFSNLMFDSCLVWLSAGTGTDLCKVAVAWVVVVVVVMEKIPSVVDVVEIFVFAAVVVHVVCAVEF